MVEGGLCTFFTFYCLFRPPYLKHAVYVAAKFEKSTLLDYISCAWMMHAKDSRYVNTTIYILILISHILHSI